MLGPVSDDCLVSGGSRARGRAGRGACARVPARGRGTDGSCAVPYIHFCSSCSSWAAAAGPPAAQAPWARGRGSRRRPEMRPGTPRPGKPHPRKAPVPRPRPAPLFRRGTMALSEVAAGAGPLRWPRVLLFGDSITQFSFQHGGWGAALADRLVRRCDVVNRGFSGYNTRWAKIILPRLIKVGDSWDKPVAVTIFFGANDSALEEENRKQHVPLAEYAANLAGMVRFLASAGVPEEHVVLVAPPPLWEPAWEKECTAQGHKLNRLNAVVGDYASACVQVAQECGTDVLDLWTLMQKDNQDFSTYLSDGLHLSPKGNEFLFSHLWPLIEKRVSSLPLLLPYWKEVAEAKPELSLLGDGDHE
ncbi:isoamyl acetate-hydrolyzing esterase 1 homolog isoform 2-T2 [Thomomys bottae]